MDLWAEWLSMTERMSMTQGYHVMELWADWLSMTNTPAMHHGMSVTKQVTFELYLQWETKDKAGTRGKRKRNNNNNDNKWVLKMQMYIKKKGMLVKVSSVELVWTS